MKSCARHENFPAFLSDEKVLFRKRSLVAVVFISDSVAGLTTSPNQHSNFKFFSDFVFYDSGSPLFALCVNTWPRVRERERARDRVKKLIN